VWRGSAAADALRQFGGQTLPRRAPGRSPSSGASRHALDQCAYRRSTRVRRRTPPCAACSAVAHGRGRWPTGMFADRPAPGTPATAAGVRTSPRGPPVTPHDAWWRRRSHGRHAAVISQGGCRSTTAREPREDPVEVVGVGGGRTRPSASSRDQVRASRCRRHPAAAESPGRNASTPYFLDRVPVGHQDDGRARRSPPTRPTAATSRVRTPPGKARSSLARLDDRARPINRVPK